MRNDEDDLFKQMVDVHYKIIWYGCWPWMGSLKKPANFEKLEKELHEWISGLVSMLFRRHLSDGALTMDKHILLADTLLISSRIARGEIVPLSEQKGIK